MWQGNRKSNHRRDRLRRHRDHHLDLKGFVILRRQVQGKIIDKKSNQRFSWIEINRKKENKNKTIATTPEKKFFGSRELERTNLVLRISLVPFPF